MSEKFLRDQGEVIKSITDEGEKKIVKQFPTRTKTKEKFPIHLWVCLT